jgi:hypothetical protein
VNYGAPYDTAAYIKQPDGWVRLKGLVRFGSSASAAMFTLPEGYRPPFDCWFTIGSDLGARLRITAAGVVSQSSGGSTVFASLNGITFPTAWNEAAWLIPGVVAPWAHDVSDIGQTPEVYVRDDGWVWLKGIASGETSAPSTIAQMPQEAVLRRNSVMLASYAVVGGLPAAQRSDMRYTGLLVHNNSAAASTYTLGGLNWFGHLSTPIVTWTTASLAGGWAAYTSSPNWLPPAYMKDHFGVVHLSGLGTSANANPTTAFTLPAGFRPAADQVFMSIGNNNLGARVDVLSSGAVRRITGAAGFCSFDGITFRAAA